jgi:hypothetical protein
MTAFLVHPPTKRLAAPEMAPVVAGRGHRHRSLPERTEWLAGFAESGQSVAAYCRGAGVSPASFYRWRREQAKVGRWAPRRFAAVQLAPAPPTSAHAVAIVCPSGHQVLVTAGTDPHWLGQLAGALR